MSGFFGARPSERSAAWARVAPPAGYPHHRWITRASTRPNAMPHKPLSARSGPRKITAVPSLLKVDRIKIAELIIIYCKKVFLAL
jgi:hypothetical protein